LLGTPTWPPSLCHFIPLGMSENQELTLYLDIHFLLLIDPYCKLSISIKLGKTI
jgi:hypothetical protein